MRQFIPTVVFLRLWNKNEATNDSVDLESNVDDNMVSLKNMERECFAIAQSSFHLLVVVFVRLETKRNPFQGTRTCFKTLEESICY